MWGWFAEQFASSMASLVYFSIFLGGLVFSVLSLLFGGDHGHEVDHHGDFGHEHGGDHHDDGYSPKLLSIRGLVLFITGFGGVGFIVQTSTKKTLFAAACGIAAGFIFASLILWMMKMFLAQQANSLVSPAATLNATGVVTTSINPPSYGEVSITVSGQEISKMATSEEPIKIGTTIRVVRNMGGIVQVVRA